MQKPTPTLHTPPDETGTQFVQHGERLYRFCLRLCGNRAADAEDLAQDVWLQAWQNRAAFQGRAQFTTYLFRIALNRFHRLRKRDTNDTVPSAGENSLFQPDLAAQSVARLDLARALDTLPDTLRDAFVLVKVEGMKYREAARVLNIPQGTVQYHVHEATLRLRTVLADATSEQAADAPESTTASHPSRPSVPLTDSVKEIAHVL